MSPVPRSDLGSAFAATSAALVAIDAQGVVVAANPAAATLLGHDVETLTGAHLCAVLLGCGRGEECPDVACPLKGAGLESGRSGLLPVVPGEQPGYALEVDVAGVDGGGAPLRLLTLRDPRPEEARRRRELLSLVAHELRTPITVTMSHAELLAEAGEAFDAATRTEMAGEVLAAVERLNALIDDLATLGRAAGNDLEWSAESVDLGAALCDGLADAGLDEEHARRLSRGLSGLPRVRADRRLAGQALAQLVVNAQRATDSRGDPVVAGHNEGDAVVVEVADSGLPIPEPERAAVFDRLSRPTGQRRSRRVTPIGVTVARALAEAMGGGAGMRSDERGCTFWIRLPRAGA